MWNINKMFADAVLTHTAHPGFKVFATYNGDKAEYGPYGREVANEVAEDLRRRQCEAYVMNLETGEIFT